MSLRNTLAAAATVTVTGLAAHAQECADTKPWANGRAVGDALFSAPVENWNTSLIQTFGPDVLNGLQKGARDIVRDLGQDADRVFKNIERAAAKDKAVEWDEILKGAHPAIAPVLTDLKDGKIDITEAKSAANTAAAAYAGAAADKLAEISKIGETVCVVFKGAPPEVAGP